LPLQYLLLTDELELQLFVHERLLDLCCHCRFPFSLLIGVPKPHCFNK
jgi:hypothetical protein